jgi:hypothetical protein
MSGLNDCPDCVRVRDVRLDVLGCPARGFDGIVRRSVGVGVFGLWVDVGV